MGINVHLKKTTGLFLLMLIFVLPGNLLFAEGKIMNVTMSPSTPNFGDPVTIDFDYCNNSSISAGRLLIAFSTFATLKPSQTVGQVFVVSSAGINVPTIGPASGTEFNYALPAPAGSACTDCSSGAGVMKHYTMTVNVPNGNMFPGCNNTSLSLFIGEKDYYMDGATWAGLDACHSTKLSWTIGVPAKQFSIHKRAQGVISNVGDLILYSIDFTYGNGDLVITDPLPPNLKVVSVGPGAISTGIGAGATTGTLTWVLPPKAGDPGISSGTVWFLCQMNITPTAGDVITNIATGSMAGMPDQSSPVASKVGEVTMSVKKSFGPPGATKNLNDIITYYLDYQVSGSKLGAYESFDQMPLGASYSNASAPPGWKFMPFGANTGVWNVMNPCDTGDNYIQANPGGSGQYPALLLNSANPNFCTGEIYVDTEIEGSYNGADSQIIVRNNGKAGTANRSIGLVISNDATPAYLTFQLYDGSSPSYPGTKYGSVILQLNKWYSVNIKVSLVNGNNDYLYQAKVWPKGDSIPNAWMAEYTQTNGANDNVWRCDGLGSSTDWRPGFNEQGGDGTVQDSFDNFVVLNPYTNANTVLYDTLPAGITFTGPLSGPATTSPMVSWNLGPISDQSGSYTWWGQITSACGAITNISAMSGSGGAPYFQMKAL